MLQVPLHITSDFVFSGCRFNTSAFGSASAGAAAAAAASAFPSACGYVLL